jgi:hypothetical protein
MSLELEQSVFHGKLNEYIIEAPGRMYIFEITKLCGYSTFVFLYKDETLLDLYNRVSHHFGCKDIKGLYIDNNIFKNLNENIDENKNENIDDDKNKNKNSNTNCCKKTDNLIPVPLSSLTTVKEFVFNNTAKEPRNLEPIYKIPFPVVYRVYLDDGNCHCC